MTSLSEKSLLAIPPSTHSHSCNPPSGEERPPQPCGALPIIFSPRFDHIGSIAPLQAARLFNPHNQIVVLIGDNMTETRSTRFLQVMRAHNITLLTKQQLEAGFTLEDWSGLRRMRSMWPSIPRAKNDPKGKHQGHLGSYSRFAYLAVAWRLLGWESAFHAEMDVVFAAPLATICAATGWPTADGSAALEATAAIHILPGCKPASYGSVHAGFMTRRYINAYWAEAIQFSYAENGARSGGDMRLTGVLQRVRGFCTAATLTHALRDSCNTTMQTCAQKLYERSSITIPACHRYVRSRVRSLRKKRTTSVHGSMLSPDSTTLGANTDELVVAHSSDTLLEPVRMPYYAPWSENIDIARRGPNPEDVRVYDRGERMLYLHFIASAKANMSAVARRLFGAFPDKVGEFVEQELIHYSHR